MPITVAQVVEHRRRRKCSLVFGGAVLALASPVAAQSLSCGGDLVEVGDPQRVLVRKCGSAVRVESVCVQRPAVRGWVADPSGQPSQPIVSLECAPAEDWTYDRGPGNFLAIVRMRDAVIESIRDGDKPR